MQCSRCGQVNASAAQFCTRCGQALTPPAVAKSGLLPDATSGTTVPGSAATPAPVYLPDSSQGASYTPSAIPFQAPLPLAGSADTTNPQGGVMPGLPSARPVPTAPNARPRRPGATDWTAVQHKAVLTFACRLCGGPVPGSRTACPICGAPHGMIANPNDGTGATYLPAGTLAPPPADPIEALTSRRLPPPIVAMRWNWGAFGASTPWLLAHPRLMGWGLITLLLMLLMPLVYFGPFYLLIPALGVLISVLAGQQGNALAWQFGKHPDIETFKRSEGRWLLVGILGILGKTVFLALLILLALFHK